MTDNGVETRIVELEIPEFSTLDRTRLESMYHAGLEVRECYRVLRKGGMNVVGEVLRGQAEFIEMNHYPKGDVFDADTCSQYYYHAHRGAGEHGHFHTFLRAGAMPDGATPAPYEGDAARPLGDEALAHLICVAMDQHGFPIGLFAVNRWVTAETWYPAADVIRMLDRFEIDHAYPSWPTNRWLSAMLRLFHPQIAGLVRHRDAMISAWREEFPEVDVYEDRRLEVTGEIPVSVDDQIVEVEAALDAVPAIRRNG